VHPRRHCRLADVGHRFCGRLFDPHQSGLLRASDVRPADSVLPSGVQGHEHRRLHRQRPFRRGSRRWLRMSMDIHVESLSEIENLGTLRPDLFGPGRAYAQQREEGGWKIVAPDAIAAELQSLDRTDGKKRLLAHAAARRWEGECAGVTLPNDLRVATDLVAQSKIAAAHQAFVNGTLTGAIQFKDRDGLWRTVDADAMAAIYDAVVRHVEACYATEKSVAD